jgi:hypothetical protein
VAVRIELYCAFCGHGVGEVVVPGSGRPTNRQLRAAFAAQLSSGGPVWIDEQPRCPRCRGQLFVEGLERTGLRRAS